jgi:hypothetical protein
MPQCLYDNKKFHGLIKGSYQGTSHFIGLNSGRKGGNKGLTIRLIVY